MNHAMVKGAGLDTQRDPREMSMEQTGKHKELRFLDGGTARAWLEAGRVRSQAFAGSEITRS